jgi:ferredoxin
MKVAVDRERCCSSGLCVMAVPDVFDQDDEIGAVRLLQTDPPESLREDIEDAAAMCPGRAISLPG